MEHTSWQACAVQAGLVPACKGCIAAYLSPPLTHCLRLLLPFPLLCVQAGAPAGLHDEDWEEEEEEEEGGFIAAAVSHADLCRGRCTVSVEAVEASQSSWLPPTVHQSLPPSLPTPCSLVVTSWLMP